MLAEYVTSRLQREHNRTGKKPVYGLRVRDLEQPHYDCADAVSRCNVTYRVGNVALRQDRLFLEWWQAREFAVSLLRKGQACKVFVLAEFQIWKHKETWNEERQEWEVDFKTYARHGSETRVWPVCSLGKADQSDPDWPLIAKIKAGELPHYLIWKKGRNHSFEDEEEDDGVTDREAARS